MRSLPGGRSGILLLLFSGTGHRSSLICGHSGVCCNCHQDLHSHGDTRYLCEGVGQRAGRCSQGKQVGNAVQHSTREENQEVKACHSQWRSDHGVNSSQEEEGEDVLQVVKMSSLGVGKKRRFSHTHNCFQLNVMSWLSYDAVQWWHNLKVSSLNLVTHSKSQCYVFLGNFENL